MRAIAFELSQGFSFSEAIKDLNIVDIDNDHDYVGTAVFEDGTTATAKRCRIDLSEDRYQIAKMNFDATVARANS